MQRRKRCLLAELLALGDGRGELGQHLLGQLVSLICAQRAVAQVLLNTVALRQHNAQQ